MKMNKRKKETFLISQSPNLLISKCKAVIAILMGSDSDWPTLEAGAKLLASFGLGAEVRVLSAHRSPSQVRRYVERAPRRGIKVFIAAAGGAAHLAGVVAAHTTQPVIGVPIERGTLKGLDSLLSTVQMPTGVPVATVAIGNATNAALLAVQILAVGNRRLSRTLAAHKRCLTEQTLKADRALQSKVKKTS